MRLAAACVLYVVACFGLLARPATASLPKFFAGAQTNTPSSSVSADIETPVWGPTVTAGGYVYDWVMEQNPNGTNPFLAQIGWMAHDNGLINVAAYAWVGGPGGWDNYREFSVPLTRGQKTNYAVVNVGNNWWSLRVNGTELVRYNLPSGPTALPQSYLESQGDNPIPDIGVSGLSLPGCATSANQPYVLLYPTCSSWYQRWVGP